VPSPEGDSGFVAFVSRHFRAGLWIVSPLTGLDCGRLLCFRYGTKLRQAESVGRWKTASRQNDAGQNDAGQNDAGQTK
jgi:hypothetical protein